MSNAMSKTERQTLIRLVRSRFKVLAAGVEMRRAQLRNEIEEQVYAEREADIKRYRERMRDEVTGPVRELLRHGDKILEEAAHDGLDRQGYSPYNRLEDAISYVKDVQFRPAGSDREVNRRMNEIIADRPLGKLALDAEENRLIEELLVGDLTSDDAKGFLASIPTLEGLVPLPSGSKAAIEAGEED